MHEFVVMPNHIHAIIEITEPGVGAIRESPTEHKPPNAEIKAELGNDSAHIIPESSDARTSDMLNRAIRESPLRPLLLNETSPETLLRDQRRKMLLSKIMGWYKMNTAKQINILRRMQGAHSWKRNYFEHIIRNEKSHHTIADYILSNPAKWLDDKFYVGPAQG